MTDAAAPSSHDALLQLPLMMRELRQWVVWQLKPGRSGEKPRKVPYYPVSGTPREGTQGDAADRAALGTFDEALAALSNKRRRYAGIGFAFLPGDGLVGIDIDKQIDADGVVSERCRKIIEACASYTELSPSGKGVHIIVSGNTQTFKNNAIGLEVFCGRQFFTCTGRRWSGTPAEVAPLQESTLRRLRATVKGAAKPSKGAADAAAAAASDKGAQRYCLAALESAVRRMRGTAEGGRNDALNAEAFGLAQLVHTGGMSEATIRAALADAARATGLADAEIQATLASAIAAGLQVPRLLPERPTRRAAAAHAPTPDADGPPTPPRAGVRCGGSDEDGGEPRRLAADATHHDVAIAVRDALAVSGHAPVYANGGFFVPSPDGLWRPRSMEWLQVYVAEHHSGVKLVRKQSDFRQVAAHLAAVCEDERFFDDAPLGVATTAGFHRLDEKLHCIITEPLQLADRQTFRLPHAPDYQAECEHLDRVLSHAFENDDEQVQTAAFWEAVGATLFGLMPRLQVAVLMLGRERSGKSLLQRVLEHVFPPEAVCALSPASWGSDYHLAALAGKRINLVGELHDESPIPGAPFKNVTGGSLLTGRHPTHRPFTFRALAAHWFASNVLPATTDRGEAFYRRWLVLRFKNTVPPERVDPDLISKIVGGELPAMLAQAFLGAERVSRTGRVTQSQAHAHVLQRWRLAANPLEQFLADEDWIELDPEAREHGTPEVYAAYRRWSGACGFRNPFGRNHFLELLDATGAARGVVQKRVGSRVVVAGLRLVVPGVE